MEEYDPTQEAYSSLTLSLHCGREVQALMTGSCDHMRMCMIISSMTKHLIR